MPFHHRVCTTKPFILLVAYRSQRRVRFVSDAQNIADKVRNYNPNQNYLQMQQRGPIQAYAIATDTMRPKEVRYFVLQQRKK